MKVNIAAIHTRLQELENALGTEEIATNPEQLKQLSQEHSYLSELLHACRKEEDLLNQLSDNETLLKTEKDPEFLELIQEEIDTLRQETTRTTHTIRSLLIPPEETDHLTTILELRAGAGGQEAALFVADCVRMYQLYATKMKWKFEPLSATPSDLGGFKEYIVAISGKNVWRFLQYEGGTHRVQRVPQTEAQGRVHTSTITIAVLQEEDPSKSTLEIRDDDLRIETTRSSGAGGQHVNKTDSAVRITHIPSGIAVFCQEDRSQHKNKDKAMRLLRAKLHDLEEKKRKTEVDTLRQEQVGTGDRAEKIRTYNFPQNRVTDHRIELTRYDLDKVMNGDLDPFSQALVAWNNKTKSQKCPWILTP